jgi:hypothetical protein
VHVSLQIAPSHDLLSPRASILLTAFVLGEIYSKARPIRWSGSTATLLDSRHHPASEL